MDGWGLGEEGGHIGKRRCSRLPVILADIHPPNGRRGLKVEQRQRLGFLA